MRPVRPGHRAGRSRLMTRRLPAPGADDPAACLVSGAARPGTVWVNGTVRSAASSVRPTVTGVRPTVFPVRPTVTGVRPTVSPVCPAAPGRTGADDPAASVVRRVWGGDCGAWRATLAGNFGGQPVSVSRAVIARPGRLAGV